MAKGDYTITILGVFSLALLLYTSYVNRFARVQNKAIKNIYESTEKIIPTAKSRFDQLIRSSQHYLQQLKYSEALASIKVAAETAIESKEFVKVVFQDETETFDTKFFDANYKELVLELAYYYNEIGATDTTNQILALLPEKEFKFFSIDSTLNQNGLQQFIKKIDAGFYDSIQIIYYPEMIKIQGDTFIMGLDSNLIAKCNRTPSTDSILHRDIDEKKAHPVFLDNFYIARTETTIKQYKLFCQATGYKFPEAQFDQYFTTKVEPPSDLPMFDVSWVDAVTYSNWLSKKNGTAPIYEIRSKLLIDIEKEWVGAYRLPTEAEWEFVAKGGIYRNPLDPFIYSGSDDFEEVGYLASKNENNRAYAFPKPVKSRYPNQLGIHDMTGNVWEWINDNYGRYKNNFESNPRNFRDAPTNRFRVLKGGSIRQNHSNYTNTMRKRKDQVAHAPVYGFRVARGE